MKSILFTKPKDLTLKCLKYLCDEGEEIIGVVVYNCKSYADSDFYDYCIQKNIRLFDGDEVYEHIDEIKEDIDMIYCNTYPQKIRDDLLKYARIDAINFHMAPLPMYRGVFGYNFAIYNRESKYGVTVHRLSEKFDGGDIIEVDWFDIDPEMISVAELVSMSELHIFELFKKTYLKYKNNEYIEYKKQKLDDGKYYSRADFEKLKKIESTDTADITDRKIRACWYPPFEGAYYMADGKKYFPISLEILSTLGGK